MFETVDSSSAGKPEPVSRARRHPVILRVSSLVVASVLSLLLINAVVPPIVADQSDTAANSANGARDFVKLQPNSLAMRFLLRSYAIRTSHAKERKRYVLVTC